MITVLVADDDVAKIERIVQVVRRALMHEEIRIEVAKSVAAAGQWLIEAQFDLLILDVAMPLRDDSPPKADGGITLLRQLRDNRRLTRPKHIVGLTAYDDLRAKYEAEFRKGLWHVVHYEEASDAWETDLETLLNHLCATQVASGDSSKDDRRESEDEAMPVDGGSGWGMPLQLLREAIKLVPAMRYAMALVGVAAVIALVALLRVNLAVAGWGVLVAVFLMSLLVVFARLAAIPGKHLLSPAIVLVWFVVFLTIAIAMLIVSSVFFKRPLNLEHWLSSGPAR